MPSSSTRAGPVAFADGLVPWGWRCHWTGCPPSCLWGSGIKVAQPVRGHRANPGGRFHAETCGADNGAAAGTWIGALDPHDGPLDLRSSGRAQARAAVDTRGTWAIVTAADGRRLLSHPIVVLSLRIDAVGDRSWRICRKRCE